MAERSAAGVPAKVRGEQGANAATVYQQRTLHRQRALIDQAFDVLEKAKGTDKDPVARLVLAYHADPLTWLERVRKLMADDAAPGQAGGKLLSMQGLFVSAARQMQETVAQGGGVQAGYIELQATDTPEDNEW